MEKEYLVTASEMRQYDDNTINKMEIPQMVLMERAAYAVAQEVFTFLQTTKKDAQEASILVIAGSGNNGADAVAAGRILKEYGCRVEVLVQADKPKECLEKQKEIALLYQIPLHTKLPEQEYDIIIDGLFGVGLNRVVTGDKLQLIQKINEKDAYKISVDIPSGVDASTGEILGDAIKADITVTFGFHKRGLYLNEGYKYAGIIKKARIGINELSFYGTYPEMFTYDSNGKHSNQIDLERNPNGNKGTFGKIFLLTGRNEMSGASILSAISALRSGCGMVCAVTEEKNAYVLRNTVPEAIVYAYQNKEEILEKTKQAINWCDVIAAGPGMGTDELAKTSLQEIIKTDKKTLILDADALTILSENKELMDCLIARQQNENSRGTVIFTPHMKEFSRLIHKDLDEIVINRLSICRDFAKYTQGIVVLKDAKTIVCDSDHPIYLNTTGNDAMATAGSGDVLTGLIASITAQMQKTHTDKSAFEAVCMSVYLHGRAGELASKKTSHSFCIASDLIEQYYNILK